MNLKELVFFQLYIYYYISLSIHLAEIEAFAKEEKFFRNMRDVEYTLKHHAMRVRELVHLYRNKRLRFETEYQRTAVWTLNRNRLLIDSILRKYDISMIFLREIIEGGKQRYECIDGQQRLQCIFQFLDNQFEITPDITPELEQKYSFTELSSETRSEILSFEINSIVVQYADDDTITEIFMRLQEGVRLNPAEKLNAERSKMRKAVIEISKHKLIFY